jgi:hypothetical protein
MMPRGLGAGRAQPGQGALGERVCAAAVGDLQARRQRFARAGPLPAPAQRRTEIDQRAGVLERPNRR